jgi:hypothetical protein
MQNHSSIPDKNRNSNRHIYEKDRRFSVILEGCRSFILPTKRCQNMRGSLKCDHKICDDRQKKSFLILGAILAPTSTPSFDPHDEADPEITCALTQNLGSSGCHRTDLPWPPVLQAAGAARPGA